MAFEVCDVRQYVIQLHGCKFNTIFEFFFICFWLQFNLTCLTIICSLVFSSFSFDVTFTFFIFFFFRGCECDCSNVDVFSLDPKQKVLFQCVWYFLYQSSFKFNTVCPFNNVCMCIIERRCFLWNMFPRLRTHTHTQTSLDAIMPRHTHTHTYRVYFYHIRTCLLVIYH